MIDRQVGRGAVLDEAINDALPKLYVQALQDNDLQPLAQPEIDDHQARGQRDRSSSPPRSTSGRRSGAVVRRARGQVDDVDRLRRGRRGAGPEPARALRHPQRRRARRRRRRLRDHRPVAATKDGEPIEGGEVSGYQLPGRQGRHARRASTRRWPGCPPATRRRSPRSCSAVTARARTSTSRSRLTGVKEQELPELDDDFAQTASEFDTMDELTADVRTRLERGKRLEQAAAARDAVLEKLLDATEVPLPDEVVAAGARRAPPGDRAAARATPA